MGKREPEKNAAEDLRKFRDHLVHDRHFHGSTAFLYANNVRGFFEWLGRTDATKEDIRRFHEEVAARGYSRATVATMVRSVKMFYRNKDQMTPSEDAGSSPDISSGNIGEGEKGDDHDRG